MCFIMWVKCVYAAGVTSLRPYMYTSLALASVVMVVVIINGFTLLVLIYLHELRQHKQ